MNMSFSKSKKQIIFDGKKICADCDVRNELNGRRLRNQLVYPYVVGGAKERKPYMPRTFPNGCFLITGVEKSNDPIYAPYKIRTNATQKVRLWNEEDGCYTTPTDTIVEDEGYLLHHSKSKTTLGCIRISSRKDAEYMAKKIQDVLDKDEQIIFEVVD